MKAAIGLAIVVGLGTLVVHETVRHQHVYELDLNDSNTGGLTSGIGVPAILLTHKVPNWAASP